MKYTHLVASLALMFLSSGALATPIQGTALQNGLNGLTQGGQFFNVNTAQYNPDEVWQITSSGASASALMFEFTQYSGTNTFGIYDIYNPNTRLQLYSGTATTGSKRILTVNESQGAGKVKFTSYSLSPWSYATVNNFTSSLFGYYLDTRGPNNSNPGGAIFCSESVRNINTSGINGGNKDHMVAFRGDNKLRIDVDGPGGNGYAPFSSGEFILAMEGTNFNTFTNPGLSPTATYDFADFVVLVQSVNPVQMNIPSVSEPKPGALLLLGLLGMLYLQRRRLPLPALS